MFSLPFFGTQALGAAGSQAALDNRFEQAQMLWPEYPDAWGHQIDAWQFGYEFDPREIGIDEAPRTLQDLQVLGANEEGGAAAEYSDYPMWQKAACRLSSNYENCLIGFRRLGGASVEESVIAGRQQAQSEQGWIWRGVYIGLGFVLFIIGLTIIGFVKPRDVARALPMAKAAMPARGGDLG